MGTDETILKDICLKIVGLENGDISVEDFVRDIFPNFEIKNIFEFPECLFIWDAYRIYLNCGGGNSKKWKNVLTWKKVGAWSLYDYLHHGLDEISRKNYNHLHRLETSEKHPYLNPTERSPYLKNWVLKTMVSKNKSTTKLIQSFPEDIKEMMAKKEISEDFGILLLNFESVESRKQIVSETRYFEEQRRKALLAYDIEYVTKVIQIHHKYGVITEEFIDTLNKEYGDIFNDNQTKKLKQTYIGKRCDMRMYEDAMYQYIERIKDSIKIKDMAIKMNDLRENLGDKFSFEIDDMIYKMVKDVLQGHDIWTTKRTKEGKPILIFTTYSRFLKS